MSLQVTRQQLLLDHCMQSTTGSTWGATVPVPYVITYVKQLQPVVPGSTAAASNATAAAHVSISNATAAASSSSNGSWPRIHGSDGPNDGSSHQAVAGQLPLIFILNELSVESEHYSNVSMSACQQLLGRNGKISTPVR